MRQSNVGKGRTTTLHGFANPVVRETPPDSPRMISLVSSAYSTTTTATGLTTLASSPPRRVADSGDGSVPSSPRMPARRQAGRICDKCSSGQPRLSQQSGRPPHIAHLMMLMLITYPANIQPRVLQAVLQCALEILFYSVGITSLPDRCRFGAR